MKALEIYKKILLAADFYQNLCVFIFPIICSPDCALETQPRLKFQTVVFVIITCYHNHFLQFKCLFTSFIAVPSVTKYIFSTVFLPRFLFCVIYQKK